jgi:hypothetical protein
MKRNHRIRFPDGNIFVPMPGMEDYTIGNIVFKPYHVRPPLLPEAHFLKRLPGLGSEPGIL